MSDSGLTIQIDYREKDVYELFKKTGVPDKIVLNEPSNLDIGDIIINTESGDQILIERKRFDDLSSSVKDGRYDEQKMRCMAYVQQQQSIGHVCVLVYLLEGDLTYCRNNTDANLALGAWISMELRDRVPVVRVLNMEEGVKWMCRLCERIKKKPEEFFKCKIGASAGISNASAGISNASASVSIADNNVKTIYLGGNGNICGMDSELLDINDNSANIKQVTQSEYLGTIKTKKKDNITPDTCAQVMLAVIPGITSDTAKIILDTIGSGTLYGLINALSIDGNLTGDARDMAIKEKKKSISVIQIKAGRKLGPAIADKLWDYLFVVK